MNTAAFLIIRTTQDDMNATHLDIRFCSALDATSIKPTSQS